jgi:hypothetical protein
MIKTAKKTKLIIHQEIIAKYQEINDKMNELLKKISDKKDK